MLSNLWLLTVGAEILESGLHEKILEGHTETNSIYIDGHTDPHPVDWA